MILWPLSLAVLPLIAKAQKAFNEDGSQFTPEAMLSSITSVATFQSSTASSALGFVETGTADAISGLASASDGLHPNLPNNQPAVVIRPYPSRMMRSNDGSGNNKMPRERQPIPTRTVQNSAPQMRTQMVMPLSTLSSSDIVLSSLLTIVTSSTSLTVMTLMSTPSLDPLQTPQVAEEQSGSNMLIAVTLTSAIVLISFLALLP